MGCLYGFNQIQAMDINQIKALTFDVFGTVADWRSTVIREVAEMGKNKGFQVDEEAFAQAWRARYEPSMHRVRTGELPWKSLDALHLMIAEELVELFNIQGLDDIDMEYLTQIWHRLDIWPDVKEGLNGLRQRFTVATLSNGNVALLTNLSKYSDVRWDCILSSELAGHYKPDPEVYLKAARLLGVEPHEIMMVAAHNSDLLAAQAVGYRSAFVYRTTEYGPNQTTDLEPHPSVDIVARDFIELASQMENG